VRGAGMFAVAVAGSLGAFDDLFGTTPTKGLRGHLTALSRGEITSGAVKFAGIGATGLAASAWARGGRGGPTDALLAGVVVAGSANLLNLFDLRPGRAGKVFLALAALGEIDRSVAGDLLAGPVGATLVLLPDDLAERSMLGDTGANALGAALGVAAAAKMSRTALVVTGAAIVGMTLLSERVSFSAIIERNEVLRRADALGRRFSS